MSDSVELWEQPQAQHIHMIAGWRQWADAGSMSSGLPQYLVQRAKARKIGTLRADGFYIFQIPGTHDLVRPIVRFDDGYAKSLETPHNDLYYFGDDQHGTVIFLGDEPHLDVERYVTSLLDVAETLHVERIIGLGGVYGELPYDKERIISCNYSLRRLKPELNDLTVEFSDYHGGASIGSYVCRRAGERNLEYVGLYAFVPMYDFSSLAQSGNAIRIENDYMAWLGTMRRINFMLKLGFDLGDLERKRLQLLDALEAKIDELDNIAPQLGVREYLARLSEEFTETPFEPLADVWEEELRKLLDDSDAADESGPDEI